MKLILPTLMLAFCTLASAQYATPTREIDVPAKTAFLWQGECPNLPSNSTCPNNGSIPAGMRAVIENVNARIYCYDTVAPTENPSLYIPFSLNGVSTLSFFPSTSQGVSSNIRFFGLQQITKIYATSVSSPSVINSPCSNNINTLVYSISGHLVKI